MYREGYSTPPSIHQTLEPPIPFFPLFLTSHKNHLSSPNMTITTPPTHFDVIVAGGGNAALVSALSAHQSGARVAIFEAAPQAERGGNSRFSSGIFRIPPMASTP